MKKSIFSKIQAVIFCAIGAMVAGLLAYLWFTPNLELTQTREASGYTVVQEVAYTETEDAEGRFVRQFRFPLNDEVAYDATLAFFFCHQEAVVYLDGEPVYSLTTSPRLSRVRTPGCIWASIPLYREDMGKEVLVELTPVYDDYRDQDIEFFIGSKYALCAAQLGRSLPEVVLSFIDVLAGLLLLLAAVYFSCKRVESSELYTLALLAISLGLWNFAQTRFAPMLFAGRNIFLYYLSLTMLMICVLPLIRSVRLPKKGKSSRALVILCMVAALLDVVQLVLQWVGVADLRQMLTLTHILIVLGAALLVGSGFVNWLHQRRTAPERPANFIWILGIGMLVDLTVYYFGNRAEGLPMTLFSMFLYVLSEGVHLFTAYTRQQHMLEEKETQLTMSRITTMMSQIRSHFVFNILNAISGLCKYDPEKADETVVRFARYLRANIDIMEKDHSIPFYTELERLEDYIVLEQLRFGERIRFEEEIESENFMLPPLILQPVVENAIKHGLSPKEEGGTITLRTRETARDVIITVTDDGVGFDPQAPEREGAVGLKNIRFRLEHLVHGTLDIESELGHGTAVTITIPREEAM